MALILNGTDGLSDVDGSAATPAIRGTDTNTGIFFPAADTIAFSEGGVEAARFDASGNLGVGTTSPAQKLDVNGSVKSTGFYIGATGTSGFVALGTTGSATDGGNFVGRSATSTFNAGGVEVYAGGAERMRVNSSGSLWVNRTTSANYGGQLQVGFDSSVANGVIIKTSSATYAGSSVLFENSSGGLSGVISNTATTTAYGTSSDYRLKDNIAPMIGALDKVSLLKPVTYKWKHDNSVGQGFIAHELQEIFPDAVIGEKDAVNKDGSIKAQGIDTSFLVATLTAAIQELKATVDAQAARIATLEGAV
jgi:hypothetical protein